MAREVVDGVRMAKDEMVGGDPDDGAVLLMQWNQQLVGVTRELKASIESIMDGPQLGTREMPQRVKEQVVNNSVSNVEQPLLFG
jgi:hypothetical protein